MFAARVIVGFYCLILPLDYLSHDICLCVVQLIRMLYQLEPPWLSRIITPAVL